jgi:hypothetical protein
VPEGVRGAVRGAGDGDPRSAHLDAGQRSTFQSSDTIQRGFCAACGTPLTYEWSADRIDLAVFAFDDPSAVEPVVQLEPDSRPRWMDHLADMPVRPALGPSGPVVSRQHPDFDT